MTLIEAIKIPTEEEVTSERLKRERAYQRQEEKRAEREEILQTVSLIDVANGYPVPAGVPTHRKYNRNTYLFDCRERKDLKVGHAVFRKGEYVTTCSTVNQEYSVYLGDAVCIHEGKISLINFYVSAHDIRRVSGRSVSEVNSLELINQAVSDIIDAGICKVLGRRMEIASSPIDCELVPSEYDGVYTPVGSTEEGTLSNREKLDKIAAEITALSEATEDHSEGTIEEGIIANPRRETIDFVTRNVEKLRHVFPITEDTVKKLYESSCATIVFGDYVTKIIQRAWGDEALEKVNNTSASISKGSLLSLAEGIE